MAVQEQAGPKANATPSQSQRLANRTAIITGSSSGVGRAIALRYAREGARVACADLQPSPRVPSLPPSSQSKSNTTATSVNVATSAEDEITPTHELINKMGGQATFTLTDVSDESSMKNLIEATVRGLGGKLDIMVNNAGISLEARTPGLLHETSTDLFDKTMAVNTRSVFLGSKYALAQMMTQPVVHHEGSARGWIINMSSIHGLVGGQVNPSYCASKGAVANLTRQTALDYAKYGVHVNAICPGHVATAIFEETRANVVGEEELRGWYPLAGSSKNGDTGIGGLAPGVNGGREGRLGRTRDIAGAAVWLASEDAAWVTGVCLPVDGGYTAW